MVLESEKVFVEPGEARLTITGRATCCRIWKCREGGSRRWGCVGGGGIRISMKVLVTQTTAMVI
jgi:hypothetical protein